MFYLRYPWSRVVPGRFYRGSCGCGREYLSASLVFSSILIGPISNHDDLTIVGRQMKQYTYCFRTTPTWIFIST